MSGIGRINIDAAGGTIIGILAPKVTVQGSPIVVIGANILPHGNGPHGGAHMTSGSNKVFAQGISICREGDNASCGHVLTPGSNKVFSN